MSQQTLESVFSDAQLAALQAYIENQIESQTAFNPANVASGTTSATLNATSGIITFSGAITNGLTQAFVLTNSFVQASQATKLNPEIEYSAVGLGNPYIQSYSCTAGVVTIVIGNSGAAPTNLSIYLKFEITN